MATFPASVPNLAALCLSNPQSFAQFTALVAELQAIVDTLGANPQATFGTVDARVDALEATATVAANVGYRGVRVANNAATPLTKLDVIADVLACEGALLTGVGVTIDLTVTGKNGMTATRAINTWYYVWVGQKPSTGEVCAILDDSFTRGLIDVSHASLTGFTRWRRVGARRTDGVSTGQLVRAAQQNTWVLYETWPDLAGPTTATLGTWTTRTLAWAAPTSRMALVATQFQNATNVITQMKVSEVGFDVGRTIAFGDAAYGNTWVALTSAQEFRWVAATSAAAQVFWWTVGYDDPI